MKELITLTAILIMLPLHASGTTYYVDGSGGNDTYNGTTLTSAFATIKACIDALTNSGDECHIRKGHYHQPEFMISNKRRGSRARPMIIRGYKNEIPVIDGTIPLTPKAGHSWEHNTTTGIYSAEIDQDIWQLFVDGEMMTNARWPNALWSDKTVFLSSHWAKSASSSTCGRMVDNGVKDLAGSGLNATGAMAILNIGSFNTFTAIVKSHTPSQNFFTYDDTFGSINFNPRRIRNQYFLEDKLEFLDNAGEWFYNKTTKTVYVKTPDGRSPAGKIRGKVQTYAFNISNCQHLHFKQMTFFGTTFKTLRPRGRQVLDGLSFDSINFKFPSYSRRMLNSTDPPQWTEIKPRSGSFNLTNCTFYGTDGVALEYSGTGVLIQNNLFEYNDWSVANRQTANGGLGTVVSNAENEHFIRNTLRFNGASGGYRPNKRNPVVKLNHIHHQCWGVIQHDGAGIQFQRGAQMHGKLSKNWVHSSPKFGLRFDAGKPPRVGVNGTIEKNVVWKCGGIMVKGDFHEVLNNLAFDKRTERSGHARAPGCTLCVLRRFRENATYMNNGSVVVRNGADVANGGTIRRVTYPLPGRRVEFNSEGNVQYEVVDANNFDFRPRHNSSYNRNKVGPYLYNPSSKKYWIPGRQLYKASCPVPPHGSTVKSTRDAVMWLNAFNASIHHVYFGTSKATVASATTSSPEYRENVTSSGNVHYLPSLVSASTYYWRVDAVVDHTTMYKGDVWSFQTV